MSADAFNVLHFLIYKIFDEIENFTRTVSTDQLFDSA